MELILIILIFGIAFFPIILLIDEISKDMRTEQPKKKKYNIQDEMSMLDEAKWVEKVIKSCKTYRQLIVARKLYRALSRKYANKVDNDLLSKIDHKLYWSLEGMRDQVTYG